jgi:hypothetical protein
MINWPGKPEFSLDASRHIGIVDAPVRDVRQLPVAVPLPPIIVERRRLSLWPMLAVLAVTLAVFAPEVPIEEPITRHPIPRGEVSAMYYAGRVLTKAEIDELHKRIDEQGIDPWAQRPTTRMRYVSDVDGERYEQGE